MKALYLKCTAQVYIPKFLKPSLESVKGTYSQVTATIHNQKGQPTPMDAIKMTKMTDYIGGEHILFGDGNSWYGLWCLSVQEASSPEVCYPHGYQAHSSKFTES